MQVRRRVVVLGSLHAFTWFHLCDSELHAHDDYRSALALIGVEITNGWRILEHQHRLQFPEGANPEHFDKDTLPVLVHAADVIKRMPLPLNRTDLERGFDTEPARQVLQARIECQIIQVAHITR